MFPATRITNRVSKTLIENMLNGDPGIGACQNHCEGRLTREQVLPLFPVCRRLDMLSSVYEAAIALLQSVPGLQLLKSSESDFRWAGITENVLTVF